MKGLTQTLFHSAFVSLSICYLLVMYAKQNGYGFLFEAIIYIAQCHVLASVINIRIKKQNEVDRFDKSVYQ